MYRGDSLPFTVTVTNDGDPVNISGLTFKMTAKYQLTDDDDDAVFQLTSPVDFSVVNAANGQLAVFISPSHTSGLDAKVYRLFYDIQATDNSSFVYTVISGTLIIHPDVTIST